MATETFTDDVEILGNEDETQLVVRGHSTQTNPLQEWQDDGASGLAQVTEDGRLRVGGDLDLAAPSAVVEANREIELPSSEPKQGIQSLGVVDGGVAEIDESLVWSSTELELEGSGGVSGLHSAQRAQVTNANSGDADTAELRAGDFAAINQGGSSETPVGQATGLHSAVENEDEAHLGKAVGVEAQISNGTDGEIEDAAAFEVATPSNDGTIDNLYGLKVPDLTEGATSNYAIHTGQGLAHFGDVVELVEQATPPGTPPAGQIYIYPKSNGKLFAKDDAGTEYDLTVGGAGPSADELSELADVSSAVQSANFVLAAGDGESGGDYRGRALVAADIPPLPGGIISSGLLALEQGGLEADISAVTIGDIVAGTGIGTMGLVTGGSDGDVLTKQADGSVAFEAPAGGGGGGLGLSSLTTGLVSWWSLDEASGTRADSHGSNDLSDNNTVTQATGLQGDAAQFTRANDENLSIADGSQSGLDITDYITIVVPIYLDSLPSTAGEDFGIVSKYHSAGQKAYSLYVRSADDLVVFSVSDDGSADHIIAATTFDGLSVDTWYLVFARYDGVSLKLSVGDSGRLVHEADVAYSDGIFSGSSDFKIGT